MTVTILDAATSVTYSVGSTPTATFAVPFPFDDADDLVLLVDGTAVPWTLYSGVSDSGLYTSGVITTTSPVTNATVFVTRATTLDQEALFLSTGTFRLATLNRELSRLWMALQDTQAGMADGIQRPTEERDDDPLVLPAAATRANKILLFDSQGALSLADLPGAGDSLTGDASLATVVAADGVTERTLAERFAIWRDVLDDGAVGDDATDNAAAFQLAIDALNAAGGGVLRVPPGVYRLSERLLSDGNLIIQGAGKNVSRLVFTAEDAADAGFLVTVAAVSQQVRIEGVSIETTAASFDDDLTGLLIDGTALIVEADPGDPFPIHLETGLTDDRSTQCVVIKDCQFKSWGRAIDLVAIGLWTIDDIVVVGRGSTDRWEGIGVLVRGGGIPVQMVVSRMAAYLLQYCVLIPDYVEGLFVTQSNFVYCEYGVYQGHLADYSIISEANCRVLHPSIASNHMNCTFGCVYLAHADQGFVTNNLLYAQLYADEAPAPIAVAVLGGANMQIKDNTITELNARTVSLPGANGIYLNNHDNAVVSGNNVVGVKTAIWIEGATTGCQVSHNSIDGVTDYAVLVASPASGNLLTWNTTGATSGVPTTLVSAAAGNTVIDFATYNSDAPVFQGGVVVGSGGTEITKHLSTTLLINNGTPVPAGDSYDVGVTLAGVAAGDSVTVSPQGVPTAGIVWCGYATASGVNIRFANVTGGALDPDGGGGLIWRVDVWKH